MNEHNLFYPMSSKGTGSDFVQSTAEAAARHILKVGWELVVQFLISLLRPITTLTEVFVRKAMGCRYFAWWNYFAGVALIAIAAWMDHVTHEVSIRMHLFKLSVVIVPIWIKWALAVVWFITFSLAASFQVEDWEEQVKAHGRWHSYSGGLPYNQKSPNGSLATFIFVSVISIGFIGSAMLALFLFCSSALSIAMRWAAARRTRNTILDVIDRQIVGEFLADAVAGKKGGDQAHGLTAPLPAVSHRRSATRRPRL